MLTWRSTASLFGLTLLLYGCGGGEAPSEPTQQAEAAAESEAPAAMPKDFGEVKPVAEYLAEPRFAGADLDRGRRLFLQCRACHSLDAGGAHKVGPNLHGMFGEPAAVKEGFNYSQALKDAGIVWTPGALEEWLVRPSSFVPGNMMAFAGIRKEEDRTDLLAYLMKETSAPAEE